MFLTAVNLLKNKTMLVVVRSTVTNHTMLMLRDAGAERYEFVYRDPHIDTEVLYKETKRMRTIGGSKKKKKSLD